MSDIIQLLPDSVANQIAAGEVIQRPASVIKELVENAVDAGAKTIHVIVVDAGRTSIQVIDDGKGMSETDARLSFERHATSKIRQAADLFELHTMGFRGEALASIAAVAQVTLKTRTEADAIGTEIRISGSRVERQEPCSCAQGANFSVDNLFYNVPARRKFLKSNHTELNNILTAFERIVLVYPDIAFTLHSNEVEVMNLRPSNLRGRIVDVFGKRFNQDLLPVDVETTMCRIKGFVGKPEAAKKKCAHQYFFVNGRYMKHPYFYKAVLMAYERLIPQGDQVPYFLYLDVNPADIDVNIHPTKTEIKFENEQAIWQILAAAVKEAIGKFNDVPTIDFDTEDKPDIPVYSPDTPVQATAPKLKLNPGYNPFKTGSHSATGNDSTVDGYPTVGDHSAAGGYPAGSSAFSHFAPPKVDAQWEQLYEGLKEQPSEEGTLFEMDMTSEDNKQTGTLGQQVDSGKQADACELITEKSPVHYQYKGMYVMTAVKSGLMIIDQHRAHVRILYEHYLGQLSAHVCHSQKVLFPEVIEFPASDNILVETILPEMRQMGFELDNLGGGSYAVNAVPAGLEGLNPVRLATDMVSAVLERGHEAKEDIHKTLAFSLARNAAIPYGQVLGDNEMESLVNNLFACSDVNHTPDGKKTFCIVQQDEIERLMG